MRHYFRLKTLRTKHGLELETEHYGFSDIELIGVLERAKLAIHKNIMDRQNESIKKDKLIKQDDDSN